MGLLRRQHGQLQLTAEGAELRSCPAALWWHLAERMPLRSAASREVQPGLILLVCVAARCTDALDATIARMLIAIGWLNTDGSPLTRAEGSQATAWHVRRTALARRAARRPVPRPQADAGRGDVRPRRAARLAQRWLGRAIVPPPFTQQPRRRLPLAVAGEQALVVAAGPVHRLSGGEIGEIPHVLADDLGDLPEDPQRRLDERCRGSRRLRACRRRAALSARRAGPGGCPPPGRRGCRPGGSTHPGRRRRPGAGGGGDDLR